MGLWWALVHSCGPQVPQKVDFLQPLGSIGTGYRLSAVDPVSAKWHPCFAASHFSSLRVTAAGAEGAGDGRTDGASGRGFGEAYTDDQRRKGASAGSAQVLFGGTSALLCK